MPSQTELRKRFSDSWFDANDKFTLLFSGRDTKYVAAAKAVGMLDIFYRHQRFNPGLVIDVNRPFELPIGDHQITGHIELVREIEFNTRKIIEVADFKTGNYKPDDFTLEHDLNLTVASYAFRHLYRSREDQLVYYMLKGGERFATARTSHHFEHLEQIVDQVATSIEDGHFYPRYSYQCKSCPYQDYCRRWSDGSS